MSVKLISETYITLTETSDFNSAIAELKSLGISKSSTARDIWRAVYYSITPESCPIFFRKFREANNKKILDKVKERLNKTVAIHESSSSWFLRALIAVFAIFILFGLPELGDTVSQISPAETDVSTDPLQAVEDIKNETENLSSQDNTSAEANGHGGDGDSIQPPGPSPQELPYDPSDPTSVANHWADVQDFKAEISSMSNQELLNEYNGGNHPHWKKTLLFNEIVRRGLG